MTPENTPRTTTELRGDPSGTVQKTITAIEDVYDPEVPVNIFDLGLIYDIRTKKGENGDAVQIDMTLTSPACPVAGTLPEEVRDAVREVSGIDTVEMNLVWEPAWDFERLSDEAKLELGLI